MTTLAGHHLLDQIHHGVRIVLDHTYLVLGSCDLIQVAPHVAHLCVDAADLFYQSRQLRLKRRRTVLMCCN